MTSNTLDTSINDLMLGLKTCLEALIEPLKKLRILNEKNEGYDSWDSISENLFREIVIASIEASDSKFENASIEFANYGFRYTSYQTRSFIEVELSSLPGKKFAFLDLIPNSLSKFEDIMVCELSEDMKPLKELKVSFNDAFFFSSILIGQTRINVNKLKIEL